MAWHTGGDRGRARAPRDENDRPAKGPGRTIFELAPLLDSADGSKRIDPKRERGDRVATLSTRGDPRGMLPARRLASLSPG